MVELAIFFLAASAQYGSSGAFCFHHCNAQKFSFVSALLDKYVGSSLFNFIMKSSSKKGRIQYLRHLVAYITETALPAISFLILKG